MDRITSRENPLIKQYRKLTGSRRLRESAGCFTMEGARLCLDAAQSGVRLQTLLLSEDGLRYPESALLQGYARQCFAIPNELARFISDTEHPQGIFAVGEIPQPRPFAPQEGKYILLDDLQDPGNLGTVLRTAEALGIDAVILSGHCPDLYSPKVIRSTMGSVFRQRTACFLAGGKHCRVEAGRNALPCRHPQPHGPAAAAAAAKRILRHCNRQ